MNYCLFKGVHVANLDEVEWLIATLVNRVLKATVKDDTSKGCNSAIVEWKKVS